jgi:hypothetical protein
VSETGQDAYERGHLAGEIAARLAGHDQHFAAINGHLADLVTGQEAVRLAVQRLADQAVSRDATVVTTAAALKDAEDARRSKGEQAWTPVQKFIAVVTVLAVVIAAAVGAWSAFHR